MKIEHDRGQYGLFRYQRPTAHSKSRAFLAGYSPMREEWAYVLREGDYWLTSAAVLGFATLEDADRAGNIAACARSGKTRWE